MSNTLSGKLGALMDRKPVFVAIQVALIVMALYSIGAVVTGYSTLNNAGADAESLVLNWQMSPLTNVTYAPAASRR